MLFHHKKSAPLPHIQIFFQDNCLYQGLLKDIPIKDSVIIEKSILFFDDPEPCNIHRTAVRVRLTEELQRELVDCSLSKGCHFLKTICPFDDIDHYLVTCS
ncbi:MAG: hypothetical protein EOM18_15685 [Clostridia bacterium]|nr:hypothetical protein [Clostridia bacterium]